MPARSSYDCIVLGAGGVGSAAAYHLARRGASVLALERFQPGHDRGSSHGETRILRLAYMEHPDYVPLLRRALALWRELEAGAGEQLFFPVGLLTVGSPAGEAVRGAREAARLHALDIEELDARACHVRFPGLRLTGDMVGVLEPGAGYLRVEACVLAHVEAARRCGAEVRGSEAVRRFWPEGEGVVVETEGGTYRAARLVITAGAWAPAILADLGLPLRVLRKATFWFRAREPLYRVERGACTFLFEKPAPEGLMYGFPELGSSGVKVAQHTGGEQVGDPLGVDRTERASERALVEGFLAAHLPGMSRDCLGHAVCMYTMTPDGHFVVDRHPRHRQVVFAAGLSGHGFKLTSVLGEVLADLALAGTTALPIELFSLTRPGLG